MARCERLPGMCNASSPVWPPATKSRDGCSDGDHMESAASDVRGANVQMKTNALAKMRAATFTTVPEDERSLVAAVLDGQTAALEALIRRFQPSMVRVARAIAGEHRAEDITQEAWIKIIRALPQFEGRSQLKTWVIRITLNQAYSELRDQSRQHRTADPLPADAAFDERGRWRSPVEAWHEETPEALLASEQLRRVLIQGLDGLPQAQRLAVTLRDLEGLTMAEVCNIIGVSESNGRVLLHRGRMHLRVLIDAFQAGQ